MLLTLHPAFPRARAIAFPIPLEAPVTTTTGASSLVASFTTACSTAATWVCTPADRSLLSTDYKEKKQLGCFQLAATEGFYILSDSF